MAVILVLTVSAVVFGTGGPHQGTFASDTDACANCHRAHTGKAKKLLAASSQYALCTTCHGGSGADTDVVAGVYLGTANGTENAGLRGGGFEQALMNTALSDTFDETGASVNITSRHTVGTSSAIAWGSGTSGNGETVSLECSNCHNPHGNSNYRMLRPKPTSLAAWAGLTAVNVPDETSKKYTISYGPNHNRDLTQYPDSVMSEVADWCSQCHTRYNASEGSGHTDSGSPPFEYRHPTQPLDTGCLKCH